jgi:ribose transport system substrate-binding protein
VIAPADSKALIPVLRRAMQAGVVVINIDNQLDAKQLEKEQLRIPFVGPDNRVGAKLVGDYLATKLTSGDAVAILEGLQTSENGKLRTEGFEESMKTAGMKIVDSQSAQWEMSKANAIASSMLAEHPEIKAILAANDSMALGVVAAAKSAGREKDLWIVGFDNIAAVQEAIRAGRILATADQHGDQLAVFGIETALKSLADKQSKPVDVQTPIDLITADSLK